eukprot:8131623-Pyramimonas_sp.AAC.1
MTPATPSNVIGDAGPTGIPGEAAAAFHNMLDVHGMCILNTFWDAGPTYFGAQGQATRPDYIAVPQGRRAHIIPCRVWWRAAKALQLINDHLPRDHAPLIAAANITIPS